MARPKGSKNKAEDKVKNIPHGTIEDGGTMRDGKPADPKKFGVVKVNGPQEIDVKDVLNVQNETKVEVKPVKKCTHSPNCQCLDTLSEGQAYFEDGPTGTIIIGDAVQQKIMWHGGNQGRGAWILRKR